MRLLLAVAADDLPGRLPRALELPDLVAVCEKDEARRQQAGAHVGIAYDRQNQPDRRLRQAQPDETQTLADHEDEPDEQQRAPEVSADDLEALIQRPQRPGVVENDGLGDKIEVD